MDREEYSSRVAAVSFSKIKKPMPEKAFEKIIEEMRMKNQKPKTVQYGDKSLEFDSMLDVGCGTGRVTQFFAPFFKSIIGIDSSEFQIERARETNSLENVTFEVGRGEAMPVPNECADLALFVFSAFFMEFEKMEIEIDRVLKQNGLAVIYGDLVQGIDLLDEASCVVSFPDSETKAINLWNGCLQPFVEQTLQTNHPQWHVFDRYETMFQDFHHLRKRRIDDVKSFVYLNLEEFLSIWNESIPFFANFARSLERDPITELEENLKRLWNIPHVNSKDIKVRITYCSFMILLDKQIQTGQL